MKTGNLTGVGVRVGVRVMVRERFLASNFISLSSSWKFQDGFLTNLNFPIFVCD